MINVSHFPPALYAWAGTLSLPAVLPALSVVSPVMTSNAHHACQAISCTFLLKESDAERKALPPEKRRFAPGREESLFAGGKVHLAVKPYQALRPGRDRAALDLSVLRRGS